MAVLHEFDFFFGQTIKVIDQRVYLLVGGGDGVLQRLPLRLAPAMTSDDAALLVLVANHAARATNE